MGAGTMDVAVAHRAATEIARGTSHVKMCVRNRCAFLVVLVCRIPDDNIRGEAAACGVASPGALDAPCEGHHSASINVRLASKSVCVRFCNHSNSVSICLCFQQEQEAIVIQARNKYEHISLIAFSGANPLWS